MPKMSTTHFKTIVESASDQEKECYHCFLDAMLDEGQCSLKQSHIAYTFDLPVKHTHYDDAMYYFKLVYQCDDRGDCKTTALEGAKLLADRAKIRWEEIEPDFISGTFEITDVPEPHSELD